MVRNTQASLWPCTNKLFSTLILTVVVLLCASANAYAQTAGGLEYTISGGAVRIDSCEHMPCPAGDLVVPASIGGYPVTSIGNRAFYSAHASSITLPNSITSIGELTFANAELTSLTLPSSLTSIGDFAFSDSGITSLQIPAGVSSIGKYAFWPQVVQLGVDPANNWYSSLDSVLFNKDHSKLIFYPIHRLETSYVIPDGVKEIGEGAFGKRALIFKFNDSFSTSAIGGLTSVTIPEGVTKIGRYAFAGSDLTSVHIPGSVKLVGNSAFGLSASLASVTFGEGVQDIESGAFVDCPITSLHLPSSMRRIGEIAFGTFLYRPGELTSVELNEGLVSIGNFAFSQNQLTSVTLPSSLVSLGKRAFAQNKLTTVNIPLSTSDIQGGAFADNPIAAFTVSPGNQSYSASDGVLLNKAQTTVVAYPLGKSADNYTVPANITSIADYAFSDSAPATLSTSGVQAQLVRALRRITLPAKLTRIGVGAFQGSQLSKIIIPGKVTRIGANAFLNSRLLKSVYLHGNAPVVGKDAFKSLATGAKAYHHKAAKGYPRVGRAWQGLPTAFW